VNESAVKEVVTKGLYGLIALTMSGVLAFSVYVVRDLKEEIAFQQGHNAKMQVDMQSVSERVAVNTEQLKQIERDVKYLVQMQQVKRSPRGEWE
jgi:hypothetical protein